MNKEYNLVVPLSSEELEEMMYDGKDFNWIFNPIEDKSITINVKLLNTSLLDTDLYEEDEFPL